MLGLALVATDSELLRTGLWSQDGLRMFATWHDLVNDDETLLSVDDALGGWPKTEVMMMKIVLCDKTPEPEPGMAGEGDEAAGVGVPSDSSDTSD